MYSYSIYKRCDEEGWASGYGQWIPIPDTCLNHSTGFTALTLPFTAFSPRLAFLDTGSRP